jgi:CheY-like chemotaxis protein
MAKILLADDDAAARELVGRALSADGHRVETVQDGHEALEKLDTLDAIDALVTDVQMPGLDGIELAARVIAQRPGVRVLLLSGYAEQLERAATLSGARVKCVLKPATLEQLRSAVKDLLA